MTRYFFGGALDFQGVRGESVGWGSFFWRETGFGGKTRVVGGGDRGLGGHKVK